MSFQFPLTFAHFISLLALIPPTVHTQDNPKDYLDAHNSARAEVGVGSLIWNQTLVTYAQRYAYTRIPDCTSEYSNGPYGENLANGSSSRVTGTDIIKIWVAEKGNYNWSSNSCVEDRNCRNYTQVVWQNSRYLGCAMVSCFEGGFFFSCNYDPPGNRRHQRPYVIKKVAPTPEPAVSPNFNSLPPISTSQTPNSPNSDSISIGLVAGLIVGAIAIILGLLFVWFFLRWKRKQKETHLKFDVSFGDEFENGTGPRKFSYRELAIATNNFGEEAKLREGGFGAVYKGFLKDLNTFVAVKKVSKRSKQGSKEYITEVKIISQLRHRNTVKLIGWCHEKDFILVYEFMSNGSLDAHLFKGKSLLTWDVRYKIVQGLASALIYLHEEGDHCVIHRDIKSSNVMLDSEFNAKLGDFGLARLVDHAKGLKPLR